MIPTLTSGLSCFVESCQTWFSPRQVLDSLHRHGPPVRRQGYCRVDGQRGSVPRPFLSVPLRTWACCFHSTRLSSHTHFTSEASSQVVPYGYSCDTTSTRRGFSACGLTSLLPTVVFLAFLSAQGLSVLGYDAPPLDRLSRITHRCRPGGAFPVLIGSARKVGVGR